MPISRIKMIRKIHTQMYTLAASSDSSTAPGTYNIDVTSLDIQDYTKCEIEIWGTAYNYDSAYLTSNNNLRLINTTTSGLEIGFRIKEYY